MRIQPPAAFGVLLAVVVAIFCSQPAALAQSKLKWRFTPGETLEYHSEQRTTAHATIEGQEQETAMHLQMDVKWTTKSVDPKGSAKIEQTMTRIQFKISIPLPTPQTIEYDSSSKTAPEGEAAQAMSKVFSALVGRVTTISMDPQGQISDVKLPDNLLAQLAELPEASQGDGVMSEKGLKEMITRIGLAFPGKPLSVGDHWDKTLTTDLPFGKQKVTTTYQYAATNSDGMEKITTTTRTAIDADPNFPYQIAVKDNVGSGEILFDGARGRIQSVSSTQKMTLEIVMGEESVQQSVEQTMTMRLASPAAE